MLRVHRSRLKPVGLLYETHIQTLNSRSDNPDKSAQSPGKAPKGEKKTDRKEIQYSESVPSGRFATGGRTNQLLQVVAFLSVVQYFLVDKTGTYN